MSCFWCFVGFLWVVFGFVWRDNKRCRRLFLLRRLTRRGRNAACGQCPASG
ncbi:TPA: hypothetical protein ACUKP2_004553, partial [Escherichia coli]